MPSHMSVAFDKVGAGTLQRRAGARANARLARHADARRPDRLALRSLSSHSPAGFYLMVEGASIDKQAHAVDAERTIWDTIEFDNAVQAALDFARRTNSDRRSGQRHAGHRHGRPRDRRARRSSASATSATRREVSARPCATMPPCSASRRSRSSTSFPTTSVDAQGFPIDPDPSRKLLLGWAAAPDRYENWLSNRRAAGSRDRARKARGQHGQSQWRDGPGETSDNKTIGGVAIPGLPRAGHDRERRDGVSVSRELSRRHGLARAHDRRPHGVATCRSRPRVRGVAVHRRLREHRRVPQDAAGLAGSYGRSPSPESSTKGQQP